MILSKTPLRMSYVGGGSDLPAFYKEEVGAVLSTSIQKFVYIALNKKFDGRIRLSYSKTEEVDCVSKIEHPLLREVLKLLNINGGIEIASMADIPSGGSGLGSSSAYTVGLLNALYAYKNQFASKEVLAKQACEVEIDRCGDPIGKQDQYAASFGGLNLIIFNPDETVSVDPVICEPKLFQSLEEWTLIFYTGRTRRASAVLALQSEALGRRDKKLLMRRMVQLAFELKDELEAGSLDSVGAILHENWRLKTQMTTEISDNQIDEWYEIGMANGAKGGKVLGAGNGGFIMFHAPPERHQEIKTALHFLSTHKFHFDRIGTEVVYSHPNY